MSDNPNIKDYRDRDRINIHQDHEVRYWSQRFDEFPKVPSSNSEWHESDEAVLEGMMKRMREADSSQSKSVPPIQVESQNNENV